MAALARALNAAMAAIWDNGVKAASISMFEASGVESGLRYSWTYPTAKRLQIFSTIDCSRNEGSP